MRSKLMFAGVAALATLLLPGLSHADHGKKKHAPVFAQKFVKQKLAKFKKNHELVDSLADAAARSHRLAGAAASHGVLNGDETYRVILEEEFNYITPENVGKWGPLQAAPGEWDFTAHDEMVEFSQMNGMAYKGHALVWHSQAPSFINDSLSAAELQSYIDQHIETTMGRYKNEIFAWDVVNEAIGDDANYRDSVLYRTLGKDFIANAFRKAKSMDKRAHLYYNDYNIAGINAKSDAVYSMLKELKEQGVPVDGIGFQMHLIASSAPSYEMLVENFRRFAELGLKVNISELDVRVANLPWDKPTKLAIQREVYHRVVSACMRVRQCESVTTWGVSDQYSWIDSTFGADDPLAWDEFYSRKPAYYGLVDGFMGVRPERVGSMPNLLANGNVESGVDGWASWTGSLSRVRTAGRHHGSTALRVADRTDSWDGAVYDLTDVLRSGQTYDVSMLARIGAQAKTDNLELNAKLRCLGGADEYFNLETRAGRFNKWTRLRGELTIPACELEEVAVYVAGPAAGVDIIVDRATVRPQMLVPDDVGYGPNIIANPYFETDASYWYGFGDATVEASAVDSKSGMQSGYVSNRTASWQGPATSLLANAQPGDTYQLFTYVTVEGEGSNVGATVKATCPDGDQFLSVASSWVPGGTWTVLAGTFVVPDCELSDLTLYFEGPDADIGMYIDDVYVRADLEASDDNLIDNDGFEEGTDGWSAWGGARIISSAERAHSGNRSGLLTDRNATWQGPVFNLLSKAGAGGSYDISVWSSVGGVAEDQVNITVKTTCSDGTENYYQLDSQTVNDGDWTQLSGSITLPSCSLTQAVLYFDGAAAGVDVYIDDVVVLETAAPEINNLVANGDFEAGVDGWVSWGGTLVASADESNSGLQSAYLSNRTGSWEGPVYSLASVVEANAIYAISTWAKIEGAAADSISITLKTTCEDGTESYNWGGQAEVNDLGWTEVAGSVTMPDCVLTEASLYFGGPAQAVNIYLDDVSVTLAGYAE